MKQKKLFVFCTVCAITILLFSFQALADNTTVSNKSNGINVTKKANWTQYGGKSTDADGNPYIKIDFDVDAANYSFSKPQHKSTNIVICLDISSSIIKKNVLNKEKALAINFIKSLNLAQNTDTYVELTIQSDVITDLTIIKPTNDEAALIDAITKIKSEIKYVNPDKSTTSYEIEGKTIYEPNAYLKYTIPNGKTYTDPIHAKSLINSIVQGNYRLEHSSTSEQRAFVLISDGETDDKIDDVLSKVREGDSKIENLTYYTIGYVQKASALELLQKIASDKLDNKQRFFNAYKESENSIISGIISDLGIAQNTIATLTDTIPKECSIIEDSITSTENIASTVNNNVITWKWDNQQFNAQNYTFSVITKLDIQQAKNMSQIYTNGSTIDTTNKSSGSSVFKYNTTIINLKSPILTLQNQGSATTSETTVEEPAITNNTIQDEATQDSSNLDDVPRTLDDSKLWIFIVGIIISACTMIISYIYIRRNFYD